MKDPAFMLAIFLFNKNIYTSSLLYIKDVFILFSFWCFFFLFGITMKI